MPDPAEWEEVPMPRVERRCRNCESMTLSREAWSKDRIVSPSHIMHLADRDNPGHTLCGKNAAGANYRDWWWEL